MSDTHAFEFHLTFQKPRMYQPGNAPKSTKNAPALKADEISISMCVEVPTILFSRPALQANLTIPVDKAPKEITPEIQDNIAEAIAEHAGMNVTITVESEEDDS